MADDIDIEEHDILQNPLMQDYLSTLRIKNEPHDEDDENGKQRIKEEPVDKQDNLEDSQQSSNPNYNEEDTGIDTPPEDDLNDPAPDLKSAVILLEDWSARLNESQCYCEECQTLFATRNALDAHNMTSHSFLVAMEAEDVSVTKKGPLCTHCNSHFENEELLIKHMYEIIEGKVEPKVKEICVNQPKPEPVKRPASAIKHTARRSEIFDEKKKETVQIKRKSETAIDAIKQDNAVAIDNIDLVYTCPVCGAVYKTIKNLREHVEENHKANFRDFVQAPFQRGCKLCHINTSMKTHNFHLKAIHTHVYTKNVSRNKEFTENFSNECHVCKKQFFTKKSLWKHNSRYHNVKSSQYKQMIPKDIIFSCDGCNLHFLSPIVAISHASFHKDGFARKATDLWKCKTCKKHFRKADKKRHELQHKSGAKIRCYKHHNNLYAHVLCKCKFCHIYFEERLFLKHNKDGCKKEDSYDKCKKCNINVNNYRVHRARHGTLKSGFILINDFLTPKISDKGLNNKSDLSSKVDSQETDTEFDSQSQDSNFAANSQTSEGFDSDDELAKKISDVESNSSKRNMPFDEPVVKAKKTKVELDTASTILYKCEACELTSNSYDSVIDHCQQHISNVQNKPDLHKCTICCMKFVSDCLNDHKNPRNVKVLTYNYLKLFKDDWLDLFSAVSKDKVEKITSESKYVTFAVKMNMLLDGQPKLTMYKCETCKNYVDPSIVYKHTNECEGDPGNFACDACGVKFSSSQGLSNHKLIHNDPNVTANSYRIVGFNSKADDFFNLKLKFFYETVLATSDGEFEENKIRDKVVSSATTVKFFQCSKCKSCSPLLQFTRNHQCLPRSLKKCSKCSYVTTNNALPAHMKWHNENKHITRSNIAVVPFKIGDNDKQQKYSFFQCRGCNIIFRNKKHRCGKVVSMKCNKCNYLISANGFRRHMRCHLEDSDMTGDKFTVIHFNADDEGSQNDEESQDGDTIPPKVTLYKCASCKCMFMTKADFCKHHKLRQCLANMGMRCPECKLVYHAKYLSLHMKFHKSIVTQKPEIVTLNKAGIKDYTLFKCSRCNIHFMNRATIRLHAKRGHSSIAERCTHCGLQLNKTFINDHINEHHNKISYSVEDFNIVCPKMKKKDTISKDGEDDDFDDSTVSSKPISNQSDDETSNDDSHESEQDEIQTSNSVVKNVKPNEPADIEKREMKTCVFQNIKYDNKLFKCTCDLSFMKLSALNDHLRTPCDASNRMKKGPCPKCNFVFTALTIKKHMKIHHDILKLQTDDYELILRSNLRSYKQKQLAEENEQNVKFVKKSHIGHIASEKSIIYECSMCQCNFISKTAVVKHISNRHAMVTDIVTCNKCGLKFTKNDLVRHNFIHHVKNNYKLRHLHIFQAIDLSLNEEHNSIAPEIINDVDDETQSEGTAESNKKTNSANEYKSQSKGGIRNIINCIEVDDENSSESKSSVKIVEESSVNVETGENSDNSETAKNSDVDFIAVEESDDLIRLFKCSECNVYFNDYETCLKHLSDHKPLHPFDCVECKLCKFQFQLDDLKIHYRTFHTDKDFHLDKLLVKEFQPREGKIKSETYYASDKVQSLLVSTTTDD